jgi:hypothetical protein
MTEVDKIREIEEKIASLTSLKNEMKNEEQAIKLTMNSIYGAIGNSYFVCFNPDVAESVTLQGQDLIKFSEKVLHKYFHEHWHLDTELHEKLGLTSVKRVTGPLVIYGDTDSNYVSFQEVVDSCNYPGDSKDLIIDINKHRLNDYLRKCFEIYSKKWNTENYQDFELETLSLNAIFLGKKKYVANLVYETPGIHFESLSHLKTTGVEMIKGGTPPFVREKLNYLTKLIFRKGRDFDIREFVKELKSIKKEFKMQEPQKISAAINVNSYDKILNDTTGFEVAKGCPIHVRASGYHNYLLNNSTFKSKYSLIRAGDKVNFYFVKINKITDNNVFAYPQGTFPYEFAPPLDYDEQFTKTILDPINRFIEVMGYNPISPNLFMVNALF